MGMTTVKNIVAKIFENAVVKDVKPQYRTTSGVSVEYTMANLLCG